MVEARGNSGACARVGGAGARAAAAERPLRGQGCPRVLWEGGREDGSGCRGRGGSITRHRGSVERGRNVRWQVANRRIRFGAYPHKRQAEAALGAA